MTAAERQIAAKYGANPPSEPAGLDVFWQKVYAPAYYLMPLKLRNMVIAALPGSHRRTWHTPERVKGPAV
jgi:hypothetical protein